MAEEKEVVEVKEEGLSTTGKIILAFAGGVLFMFIVKKLFFDDDSGKKAIKESYTYESIPNCVCNTDAQVCPWHGRKYPEMNHYNYQQYKDTRTLGDYRYFGLPKNSPLGSVYDLDGKAVMDARPTKYEMWTIKRDAMTGEIIDAYQTDDTIIR